MPDEDARGHSSYITWLIYANRAVERILPALKHKGKYGWAPALLLCLLVLATALSVGIYIDGYGVHPPQQFTGICPPPAQITHGSCITKSIQVVTGTNGAVTTVTYTQQAGTIITTTTTHGGNGSG